jgi:hypothetical protein
MDASFIKVNHHRLRKYAKSCVIVAGLALACSAQGNIPPSEKELGEITQRGRMLAAYDAASWQATDAVLLLKPAEASGQRYLAKKTNVGWEVVFGRLNESKDQFSIAYEAEQKAGVTQFTARKCEPPIEDSQFYLFAARAIETVLADFSANQPPYNVAVLPAQGDQLYVYIYPASTSRDVFRMGGDARYLISSDGMTIVEKRQLHRTVIENKLSTEKVTPQSGYHTHVLSDVPEDTDVFYVLSRKPSIKEYVASAKFFYQIDPDGAIHYLGETSKVLKK